MEAQIADLVIQGLTVGGDRLGYGGPLEAGFGNLLMLGYGTRFLPARL